MKTRLFKSASSDWYRIPEEKYQTEINEYQRALKEGDNDTLSKFETGETGWKYVELET